MAKRIVFLPTEKGIPQLCREVLIDFEWVPGMAISQARKSVRNLHAASCDELKITNILEISTRSEEVLGLSLSAFNLNLITGGKKVSVETAYQSSKVFSSGGPYVDIMNSSSLDAKKDPRLKFSGPLIGFSFENQSWPLKLSPNFYDYLYISALSLYPEKSLLDSYQAFTDIAFSQISLEYKSKRSYNCQARSVAMYCSLKRRYSESEMLAVLKEMCLDVHGHTEQLDLF